MTIRLRLTLWYTALLGATLILFSVLVYSALAANLNAQYVQDAANQAVTVSRALAQQIERDISLLGVPLPTDINNFSRSFGVQVFDLGGRVRSRSENVESFHLPIYSEALEAIHNGRSSRRTIDIEQTTFLIYSVPLVVRDQIVAGVQVIKPPAEGAQNALNQISRYLTLGTALCLVIAAAVGAVLARRTLAPIDQITRTASGITRAKDLGQRLSIPDESSEVGMLSATFNEMLDRIQRLFTAQERLIADVSHELRTPLTTVQGNVDLLQRMVGYSANGNSDCPSQEHEIDPTTLALLPELLGEVENETTRMSTMIRDLLLLAQADSGVLRLQMAPVEIDTLLLDVYRQARKVADRVKGVGALDIRLGSEDQALVWGDRERLRQVLLNLVDNAVKYTPTGGSVTLSLENKEGWVRVSIQDTGIGIKPDDQELIFERFYRTDKARSRELGGSGLGLSIVKWIAQAHKGKVVVESRPGEGSTFSLWLPEYREKA